VLKLRQSSSDCEAEAEMSFNDGVPLVVTATKPEDLDLQLWEYWADQTETASMITKET